jgi:anhydro-N-acetylmuramic acid kinase
MNNFHILGLMSGSSLDGLDVAFCEFELSSGHWKGKIIHGETFPFGPNLFQKLAQIRQTSALDLIETEAAFVSFCAESIRFFTEKNKIHGLAIASHGHTVFHNPAAGYTLQIGNGGLLSGQLQQTVVSDFRTLDVGNGGQGAPLVPGAEKFLFSEFDACLNLGGIANLSFPGNDPFLGFDVSPCNQLLNLAASWKNLPFDKNGILAQQGRLIPKLLETLEAISFYKKEAPKSLGNEEVFSEWAPLLPFYRDQPENVLYTLCLHIASRIGDGLEKQKSSGSLLITGGGAFHSILLECIKKRLGEKWSVEVPGKEMISFKEAYCFAFLGLLRILEEKNVFRSITGAKDDLICGAIYGSQWLKM